MDETGINIRLRLKAPPLLITLAALFYFSSPAVACTCGTAKPCEAYAYARVVFVGVVMMKGGTLPKDRLPRNAMSTTLTGSTSAAHFRIEEAFLAVVGKEIEVTGEGTTCDYYFEPGVRYLVYAYPSTDGRTVHTNICSGTMPLAKADEQLAYLRGVADTSTGGTFQGDIRRFSYDTRKNRPDEQPARGVGVILESGNRRFRSASDEEGRFVLGGLPAGRYRVRTEPAANFSSAEILAKEQRTEWEVNVPDHGCLKEWFEFLPRGELTGQLVSGDGRPPEDIWVEIIFADRPNTEQNEMESAKVGADGRFKFSFLPAGKYLIGFNLKSGPFRDYPYPEFYYPGVTDRKQATVLTLEEGAVLGDIKLPMPERLPERGVEGVAVWPDGRPAVNVAIVLQNPRTGWEDGNFILTDSQGKFTVVGVEGQTYELSALVQKGIPLVHSKPVPVKVEKVNRPVRLVIESP